MTPLLRDIRDPSPVIGEVCPETWMPHLHGPTAKLTSLKSPCTGDSPIRQWMMDTPRESVQDLKAFPMTLMPPLSGLEMPRSTFSKARNIGDLIQTNPLR